MNGQLGGSACARRQSPILDLKSAKNTARTDGQLTSTEVDRRAFSGTQGRDRAIRAERLVGQYKDMIGCTRRVQIRRCIRNRVDYSVSVQRRKTIIRNCPRTKYAELHGRR